jgi:hypothetical protein
LCSGGTLDNWESEMSEIVDEQIPNMLPIRCTALLTSFETEFRTSAEMQSISETGAVVRLSEPVDTPDQFSILIPKYRINVGCRIVWRHLHDVGLQFDRKIEIPVFEDSPTTISIAAE